MSFLWNFKWVIVTKDDPCWFLSPFSYIYFSSRRDQHVYFSYVFTLSPVCCNADFSISHPACYYWIPRLSKNSHGAALSLYCAISPMNFLEMRHRKSTSLQVLKKAPPPSILFHSQWRDVSYRQTRICSNLVLTDFTCGVRDCTNKPPSAL